MGVRNCAEIGENLQKIVARLMANDDLVKLLYYTDKDPINHENLSSQEKQSKVYNQLIRIIPSLTNKETAQSVIVIRVSSGNRLGDNSEFKTVQIDIEVFVPLTQWFIKDTNLRPFAILGQIQSSLDNKTINGLGKMQGGDFRLSYLSEEISCYETSYEIISYD